jgi:hypothetical protein
MRALSLRHSSASFEARGSTVPAALVLFACIRWELRTSDAAVAGKVLTIATGAQRLLKMSLRLLDLRSVSYVGISKPWPRRCRSSVQSSIHSACPLRTASSAWHPSYSALTWVVVSVAIVRSV